MIIYRAKQFRHNGKEDRPFDQFFVWNRENIHIMDNHRAALWCWINDLKKQSSSDLKLLHIDNHPDMSPKGLHCSCVKKADLSKLALKTYLVKKHSQNEKHFYGEEGEKLFSYENFLSAFIENNPQYVKSTDVLVTHSHWETKPKVDPAFVEAMKKYIIETDDKVDCSRSAKRLYKDDLISLFRNGNYPGWIVDLDFDYFYNEKTNRMNYKLAEEVIKQIKKWYDLGKIISLTVAWSPEFLINRNTETMRKGLLKAKKINSIFCKIFNINEFKI